MFATEMMSFTELTNSVPYIEHAIILAKEKVHEALMALNVSCDEEKIAKFIEDYGVLGKVLVIKVKTVTEEVTKTLSLPTNDNVSIVKLAFSDETCAPFAHKLFVSVSKRQLSEAENIEQAKRCFTKWWELRNKFPMLPGMEDVLDFTKLIQFSAFYKPNAFALAVKEAGGGGVFVGQKPLDQNGKLMFVPSRPIGYIKNNRIIISLPGVEIWKRSDSFLYVNKN